jgi:hypothetical protein
MKKLSVSFLLTLICLSAFGGGENFHTGARSAAMGNASVMLSDLWSAHHNQAGLASLNSPQAGMFVENRFLLRELSISGATVALPTSSGTFGIAISNFGHQLHRQGKYGIAYGRKLGENISAGVRMNYENTRLGNDYGDNHAFTVEGGMMATLSEQVTLGVHVYNPTRAKMAEYNDERLPTIMRLGMGYMISEHVTITLEAEKEMDSKVIAKFGIEYCPAEKFYLRGGVASNPMFTTFGFGVHLEHLTIDFATGIHSVLGHTPHFSLIYQFKQKKKSS